MAFLYSLKSPFCVNRSIAVKCCVEVIFNVCVPNSYYWWGIIPVLIGGFCGSYFSKFGRLLLTPDLSAYQREKILQTTRILTIMWIILSVIFFVLGYGLTKVTY